MTLGWLTPDSEPDSMVCYRVFLPSGDDSFYAFMGAITLLGNAWNWEKYGSVEPETIAKLWREAIIRTSENTRRCMEIGTIFIWPANSIPDGALVCDGAQYNTADYPYLFGLVGYNFGGSGTVFNVPDMREMFPLGTDPASADVGATGGTSEETLTINQIPSHQHTLNEQVKQWAGTGASPVIGFNATPTLQTNAAGGGEPHNNMPPFRKVIFCIQAK